MKKLPKICGKFFFIMTSVKKWKESERPREKMKEKGREALTDSELIAILLNSGTKNKDVIELSHELLMSCDNSLRLLSQMSFDKLLSFNGIGTAKAARLSALFELASRMDSEITDVSPIVTSSVTISKIFSPLLKNLQHEECWVVYMNRGNKIISKEKLSSGGVSATVIDIRMIIKKAVEKLASGIILIHNHPSGNPYPGEQDKRQTRLLRDAAALLDISLLDHIIIARNKYYSFADEGVG